MKKTNSILRLLCLIALLCITSVNAYLIVAELCYLSQMRATMA